MALNNFTTFYQKILTIGLRLFLQICIKWIQLLKKGIWSSFPSSWLQISESVFFLVTVAVTKVVQSLLAALIILYQLSVRTDDKFLLSLSMNFEKDEISCLIISHITCTDDDFVTLLALNSFRKPLRYLDSLNNWTPIPTAVLLTCNVI